MLELGPSSLLLTKLVFFSVREGRFQEIFKAIPFGFANPGFGHRCLLCETSLFNDDIFSCL